MMNYSAEQLGKILVEKKYISKSQLKLALDIHKQSGEKLENILIDKKWITEDVILTILSDLLGLPRANLDSCLIDQSIINLIPLSMARKYRVMPIIKIENELAVGMSNPLDIFAIDAIQYHTGCKLLISIATDKEIDRAIDRYYSLKDSMDQVVQSINETETTTPETVEDITISEESDEVSVIKLVNLVLLQAIKDRASDIHFEPDEGLFRIRYRIDGILHEVFTPPKNLQANIISRIKIMADMDVSERRIPQDGRFRLKVDNREIDIRASILPTVEGEKAVLRILDKANSILKLTDMGFFDDTLQKWLEVIKSTEGLILITGPTGSGKTTTLYAVLNEINSKEKNIVTLENPVEYKLPLINQINVNTKAGLTFANGLRSILRQDPDIIMVGEIRDRETTEIAIRSALTGHLVLSTLHTNDAPGAVARLIDMGMEPFLIESSLIAVLAQRLVRKICPRCKREITIDKDVIKSLHIPDWITIDKVYQGKGCVECNHRGYKGRTAIYELLIVDDKIRKLIIKGAHTDAIREAARNNGMRTLKEEGLQKVAAGLTTIEEVMRVAYT